MFKHHHCTNASHKDDDDVDYDNGNGFHCWCVCLHCVLVIRILQVHSHLLNSSLGCFPTSGIQFDMSWQAVFCGQKGLCGNTQ
jgi:hypothetical protein